MKILIFVASLVLQCLCQDLDEVLDPALLAINVTPEIAKLGPFATGVAVQIVTDQCPVIQDILGVSYDQVKAKGGPNLNDLTIWYRTAEQTQIFNIADAASGILAAGDDYQNETFVLFAHGFLESPSDHSFGNISQAYLNIGKHSILAIDSSSLIGSQYFSSVTNTQFIGERLAEVLVELYNNGVPASQMHLVGHSLGAHICGFTGKHFFAQTGQLIARITGLDPAGPCYENGAPGLRPTDAAYVDCIHTDEGQLGIVGSNGQSDYFANGGRALQPGCTITDFICSHNRSWVFYTYSVVHPELFQAVKCDSWELFKSGACNVVPDEISVMGYGSASGTTGNFYMQTSSSPPYGRGQESTVYSNDKQTLFSTNVDNVGNIIGLIENIPRVVK